MPIYGEPALLASQRAKVKMPWFVAFCEFNKAGITKPIEECEIKNLKRNKESSISRRKLWLKQTKLT